MLNNFPEQQAICAFFLDFVLLPRHPDSVRGHLEHLYPLYQSVSSESPLALATSAVALAISGNSPTRQQDHHLARQVFGRALRKTSTAIRDPIESLKDSTLMAVLLLGLFERIAASSQITLNPINTPPGPSMTSTHNAGAAALVKHRGPANCASSLAIGLLFAVRTQLVEHAIEEGTPFKRCPDGLSAIFQALPQNAAARLTSATTNIADLRSCAKSALHLPSSPAADQEVSDLLEYAISIDLLVAAWPETLPEEWQWQPATHFPLPTVASHGYTAPSSAFIYAEDKKDVYLDLWVMSIWNQYRAARIRIQSIIHACINYLGPAHEEQWYWRTVYAKMIAQQMCDEICASVPFALGTRTCPGDDNPFHVPAGVDPHTGDGGVEFPYVFEKGKQGEEHRRAAGAVGGWHLLDPLRVVVRAKGESRCGDLLREGQSEWCAEQMERIGRICGLQGHRGVDGERQLDASEGLVGGLEVVGGAAEGSGHVSVEPSGGVWERKSFEFPL